MGKVVLYGVFALHLTFTHKSYPSGETKSGLIPFETGSVWSDIIYPPVVQELFGYQHA